MGIEEGEEVQAKRHRKHVQQNNSRKCPKSEKELPFQVEEASSTQNI
jgi:hypothetical protein